MSMETKSQELSRRSFCKCSATTALSAVVFLTMAKPAAAKGKMTQKKVAYQDTPKGTQECDGCKLFQPPSACKSVEGEISPKGWCNLFQPMGT
jgi:hypothetical protein